MNYYVFSCKLKPRDGNPRKDEFLGAHSHTWVHADSLDSARIRVADFFSDSEWVIDEIEVEDLSDLSRHPWNHKDTQPQDVTLLGLEQSWRDLHRFGIGSEIAAYREQ